MKMIAFYNNKGGVGKTSTAINIAYTLSRRENRVLLIDFDGQCNSSRFFSSWDTTYKTVGHPYFWGSARNEQVINKNEEIISTITFMCNDIKYYNEEGYTPVLDFTSYSEFVSYTKDRPGFIGCSNLVDDGTIDYILFVIYGA